MSHPNKRQRSDALPNFRFGAPSDADSPSAQSPFNTISSAASSTRAIPPTSVPSLTTLCARAFVSHFLILRKNEKRWKKTSKFLSLLPDNLTPKIFSMLTSAWPGYLPHEFIVTHFFVGASVTLSSALPGVNKRTILAVSRLGDNLLELKLSGLEKIPDESFASIIPKLIKLRTLVLRGCTKAGDKTVAAVAKHCSDLRVLNLNYTSASPGSVSDVVASCSQLEVLKLAGLSSWTDAKFKKFSTQVGPDPKFPNLTTLKLRETSLSELSLTPLLCMFPNIRRLDVSFTLVVHPPFLSDPLPRLEKLSLTSTAVDSKELVDVIRLLPDLKSLSLGALGVHKGSISNSSAMTMSDSTLRLLTDILETFTHLENINLIGNVKLGTTSKGDSALLDFISRVGRKCRWLNLASLSSLKSFELSGLMPGDDTDVASSLETLILNNTGIDDDASPFLASCTNLVTLGVSSTKMTKDGLLPIVDSCPKLANLDITACRGVSVVDRRRFFEVWEQERSM